MEMTEVPSPNPKSKKSFELPIPVIQITATNDHLVSSDRARSNTWKHMATNWKFVITVLLPVMLTPLLVIQEENGELSTKFKCAYVVILMIVSWMLQLLPIGVTSLLPLLLFPPLGVLDSAQVHSNYIKNTTVMFVGGLIIALAVEFCNLHRRIALCVMKSVGCSPIRLTLGTMITTTFLSMWINNTATAGMAIPIVSATVDEMFSVKLDEPKRRRSVFRTASDAYLTNINVTENARSNNNKLESTNEVRKKKLKKMLLLSVCLAANIGGTGVITGSPSNLIFIEHMKNVDVGQSGKYMDVSFATWMLYNIPAVTVNLIVCWLYLVIYFTGFPESCFWWKRSSEEHIAKQEEEAGRQRQIQTVLIEKYESLGPISFHEGAVLVLFVTTVLLWFFRDPGFMTGWAYYLPAVEETTVAVCAVVLFFVIPRGSVTPRLPGVENQPDKYSTLLDWKYVQESVPWGLVILIGGGFAMSDGVVHSGLSEWLGEKLIMYFDRLPKILLLFVIMGFTVICTSVASNSATANTLIALLIPLSRNLNLHPLFLTLPTTVSCSYAFLLPISSGPNALVHQAAGGDLSVVEMVKVMAFPNVICVVFLFLLHITYGNLIFHFNDYAYIDSNATSTLSPGSG